VGVDGRTLLALRSVIPAAARPPAGGAGGKANRLLGVANSYSNGGQIVNNVFVTKRL